MTGETERRRRPTVVLASDGLTRKTVQDVQHSLSRAGMEVRAIPRLVPGMGRADLWIVDAAEDGVPATAGEGPIPVLGLASKERDEERSVSRGAWGAYLLPIDGKRLLESVNRILIVGDRSRLAGAFLGIRRWLRRFEKEGDPERAVGFLRWAPKVKHLESVWRRLPPPHPGNPRFASRVARSVAERAGGDLFDDLVPLEIDLEFRLAWALEGRPTGEAFAGDGYYEHLLDAKMRLEELFRWGPVRRALGRRAQATSWIRTPQLDQFALAATRLGKLPPLEIPDLVRLVRDLRRFHRVLRGQGGG